MPCDKDDPGKGRRLPVLVGGAVLLLLLSVLVLGSARAYGIYLKAACGGRLESMVVELAPEVESLVGHRFRTLPRVCVATPPEARRLDVHLYFIAAGRLYPEAGIDERKALAVKLAAESPAKVGAYYCRDNTIYVVPENIRRLAENLKEPVMLTDRFLRAVVVHELVHALDEQAHGTLSRIGDVRTPEEMERVAALSEGHADSVTRRVLEKLGDRDVWRLWDVRTAQHGAKAYVDQAGGKGRESEWFRVFEGLAQEGNRDQIDWLLRYPLGSGGGIPREPGRRVFGPESNGCRDRAESGAGLNAGRAMRSGVR